MYRIFTVFILLLLTLPTYATTFNVKDYGAVADGKADDTPAFNKALEAAAKDPGSTVFAPLGRYLIAGTITVTPDSTLKGEYNGPGRSRGTVLLVTGGKGQSEGPGCVVLVGGSGVRNMAFEYPEQSADSNEAVPYPYTISAGVDSRIEDIFLLNSYQGINLDGSNANMVRNIWGEPLRVGINADHVYDISRIENVHFWPYFTLNKPLRNWVQNNGVAFQFGRSDWQYCTNTFSFGYYIGYRFYTSREIKANVIPGGTTNGNFTGIGADSAVIAVDVEDSFSIGVSITNGEFAPFGGSKTCGVRLQKGNTGNLTLVNCNFWAVTNTVAEVNSGSLNMTGCNIENWGVTEKNAPAFLVNGGRINVNGCTINKGGLFATLDGTDTRAIFSSNMGKDPLSVVNNISDRAVFGLNNPTFEMKAGTATQAKPAEQLKHAEQPKPKAPKKEIPKMMDAGKNLP